MMQEVFPIPMFIGPVAGASQINDELAIAYKHYEDKFKQHDRWDSHTHLLSDPSFTTDIFDEIPCPLFNQELKKSITEYLLFTNFPLGTLRWKINSSWFTLTKKGQSARAHDHAPSDISGVYYLDTTGYDGNIVFNNPCALMKSNPSTVLYKPTIEIPPINGFLILFPSWLQHFTRENTTDKDRVSLSFNITIDYESSKNISQ
jgi:uncharacterized protein (TIGR02466 family)